MPSAWVPHGGEGELGEIFRGWSKEEFGTREMESDVVSVLISKSYSATEEPTFSISLEKKSLGRGSHLWRDQVK